MQIQERKGKMGGEGGGGRGQKEVDPSWSTDSSPIRTRLAMPPNVLPPPPLPPFPNEIKI